MKQDKDQIHALMQKIIIRYFFLTIAVFSGIHASAQDSLSDKRPEMAVAMRSNGKIYVVVLVLAIILSGLFLYVFRLDRKISRLEKEAK
jgi:CcmD family protein